MESKANKHQLSTIKQFGIGIIIGFISVMLFGMLTYPWDNPTFEGRAGYHFFAMLLLTPIVTLLSGIASIIYFKLKYSNRD